MNKPLHSKEQIEAMRKRLYDRGGVVEKVERHELQDEKVEVSQNWEGLPEETTVANTSDLRAGMRVGQGEEAKKPKRHYRRFVLIGSLLIFVVTAALTSLYLYFGGNQISSDNILIQVQSPSLVGGGETLPLEVTLTNLNSVAIDSGTLIIKYPPGTQSLETPPRTLTEDRLPIDTLAPDEVRSIPIRVALFGEENSEKNITVTFEYRTDGSNGTFYKELDPIMVRIGSTPLVLRVEGIEKVASGQEVEVTFAVVSNVPTSLKNVLITAEYPKGFEYRSADPEPVFGQEVWRVEELLSGESAIVTVRGVVTGLEEETQRLRAMAGLEDAENQFRTGATLSQAYTDFLIEQPFIDVALSINRNGNKEVYLPAGKEADILVVVRNTLPETIYDMALEVVPGGNALTERSISGGNGFYDSNTGSVRWDVANNPSFTEIRPGESRELSFSVTPNSRRDTASFDLVVNVFARRVSEANAQEVLVGSVGAKAKYYDYVQLGNQVARDIGRFGGDGPIPPKVGQTTVYTVTLVAEAGANDVTNAVIKTSLPTYVTWLDQYDVEGEIAYNTVSKQLEWRAGDIEAEQRKEFTFQVSIKPSLSQVGSAPTLVNAQSLRANDRFTGVTLQGSARPVTTELSTELGFTRDNGKVVE